MAAVAICPRTRWEEAEDRLHLVLDVLECIQVRGLRISFLNNPAFAELTGPDGAHERVRELFMARPAGGTPLLEKWKADYVREHEWWRRVGLTAPGRGTIHIFLTDGAPSTSSSAAVVDMVRHRPDWARHPTTFLSCTNNPEETEWMKELDEVKGPRGEHGYIAELDDFQEEKAEVLRKQGPFLPFTYGVYLICMLVACINPDDLDNMDESSPFAKEKIESIMGRPLSAKEYDLYLGHFRGQQQQRR